MKSSSTESGNDKNTTNNSGESPIKKIEESITPKKSNLVEPEKDVVEGSKQENKTKRAVINTINKDIEKNIEKGIQTKTEPGTQAEKLDHHDSEKKTAIQRSLKNKYLQVENKKDTRYHFKDRENAIAFEKKGDSITSKHDDKHITSDMLNLAIDNGWEGIAVKGTKGFKSEVWIQASLKGVAVRGFRPTKLDKEKLEQEKIYEAKKLARSEKIPASKSMNLNSSQEKVVGALKDHMKDRGDSKDAIDNAEKKVNQRFSERNTVVGKVVDLGNAKYLNKNENDNSYFVELKTADGSKKIWGVKLEELVRNGHIKKGDNIALEKTAKEKVEVGKNIVNEKGVHTKTSVSATRNSFKVHNLDQINEATKNKLINADKTRSLTPALPERNISRENQPIQTQEIEREGMER
ncbi:MAG: LPD7 domain-containing protein [Cellvibrionaceae bacterium]